MLYAMYHCSVSTGREDKLEQREQAAQGLQSDALALKAELHRLAGTLQGQAIRQATDAAEEKKALARQQARLDTLQVCLCPHLQHVMASATQLIKLPQFSYRLRTCISKACSLI